MRSFWKTGAPRYNSAVQMKTSNQSTYKKAEALRKEAVTKLREIFGDYRRAGVPEPFIRELFLLQLYRLRPRFAKRFEEWNKSAQ